MVGMEKGFFWGLDCMVLVGLKRGCGTLTLARSPLNLLDGYARDYLHIQLRQGAFRFHESRRDI
jgi:hypothetical protein